jgi:hypothetical protein
VRQEKPIAFIKTIDAEISSAMWRKRNSYIFRGSETIP